MVYISPTGQVSLFLQKVLLGPKKCNKAAQTESPPDTQSSHESCGRPEQCLKLHFCLSESRIKSECGSGSRRFANTGST